MKTFAWLLPLFSSHVREKQQTLSENVIAFGFLMLVLETADEDEKAHRREKIFPQKKIGSERV